MVLTTYLQVSNLREVRRSIDNLEKMLNQDRDRMAVETLHGVAKVWDRNFLSEGSMVGGWPQLAERTVAEREREGFGGEHPIMIRYGQLHELTTRSLMRSDENGVRRSASPRGGDIEVSVRTHRGTMEIVARGSKAMLQERGKNRPPRPYWFVSNDIMRTAKDSLVPWLARRIDLVVR